jgi:ATP-dependent protease ClpP protease subunit
MAARFSRPFASFVTNVMLVVAGLGFAVSAAHAEAAHLRFARSPTHPDVLVMIWNGKIEKPMSEEISTAFEDNKASVKAVELKINSGGGSVTEGERVIKVLQDIKKTHKLYTSVGAGKKCGSMCVFIYVQGEKRLAAPASLWLFHEVSHVDRDTHRITELNRRRWEELVDKYWVPAGVNKAWIESVKTHTVKTDYWQSGESLLQDGSNIITQALSDEHRRVVVPPKE